MSRFDWTKRRIGMALAAALLATAGLAWADGDHSTAPPRLKKKDHFVRDALDRMTFADPTELTLFATCDCVEPVCDGGLMLSCGGEIEPYFAGFLTAVRRTSRQTCYVCGCAVELATLRATPVCID
jgi:hypothetical protein